jgi:hypothetical protein
MMRQLNFRFTMLSAAHLCLMVAAALYAQSPLSVQYPGGLPLAHASGPSLSLAGAGIGVRNDFFGMADNPANLGGMNRAVFSAVTSFDFLTISEGNAGSTLFSLSPRLLSFSFPISPVGAFGFSLDRRSSTNLRYVADTLITVPGGASVRDSLGVAIQGGLTSWQAGWGRAFGRRLFVGAAYERMYLSSNDITLYSAGTEGGVPQYDSIKYLFRGNALRAGALFTLQKLTLGISGEYVFTGDAQRTVGSTDSTLAGERTFSLTLPPSLSIGASYAFSPSWMAAVSSGITLWQNYRSPVKLGGAVDNALSFAGGAQYIPAPSLLTPKYWEIMQYRAGFRYCELPVTTGSEFAFDLGVGLPLLRGGGLVDLVAEYGKRSDSRFTGHSEQFLHVSIGINGGRKWSRSTGIRY